MVFIDIYTWGSCRMGHVHATGSNPSWMSLSEYPELWMSLLEFLELFTTQAGPVQNISSLMNDFLELPYKHSLSQSSHGCMQSKDTSLVGCLLVIPQIWFDLKCFTVPLQVHSYCTLQWYGDNHCLWCSTCRTGPIIRQHVVLSMYNYISYSSEKVKAAHRYIYMYM